MHLHGRLAVFERVGESLGLAGELALLTHGDETDSQGVGRRRAEEEASGVNANDLIRAFPSRQGAAVGAETIHGPAQAVGVREERHDVLEEDAGFGKIRHVAHEAIERGGGEAGRRREDRRHGGSGGGPEG